MREDKANEVACPRGGTSIAVFLRPLLVLWNKSNFSFPQLPLCALRDSVVYFTCKKTTESRRAQRGEESENLCYRVLAHCKRSFPTLLPSVLFVPLWFFESKTNHRGTGNAESEPRGRISYFAYSVLVIASMFSLLLAARAWSEVKDPFDPFDTFGVPVEKQDFEADEKKTAEELIQEASYLLVGEHLLDARTKLLLALKKDPKAYQAHLLLSSYYLVHVGHFRLALQYVKQALALFQEKHGQPPYGNYKVKDEHARLLYLLSQVRLNLDNYQGAIQTLNDYASFGYMEDWYPGSRSWILMKLGRIPEAIRVAQLGYMALSDDNDKGQILNVLGILYSMNDEKQASLDVFKNAIAHELSLGTMGQPATPLNNAGEVYRELFDEEKAESSWLRAKRMHDGCEHVLPSLNLAILYLEQLNLQEAKKAIDSFETCVAQYPLRNGEEHRALVNLARGRIKLLAGDVAGALQNLSVSLERKQWFGKIGTNEDDLQSAALMSMAAALSAKANSLEFEPRQGILGKLHRIGDRAHFRIRSWWHRRRAIQILTGDLNNLEDLYVRNTDSLLDYSALGDILRTLPTKALRSKIENVLKRDKRQEALSYYQAYMAENLLEHGSTASALQLIDEVLEKARSKYDQALLLRVLLLKLSLLDEDSTGYAVVAQKIFGLNRASLKNQGIRLPVNVVIAEREIVDEFQYSPFLLDNSRSLEYLLKGEHRDGDYLLQFFSRGSTTGSVKVKSTNLREAVQKLSDEVFNVDLK